MLLNRGPGVVEQARDGVAEVAVVLVVLVPRRKSPVSCAPEVAVGLKLAGIPGRQREAIQWCLL